MTGPKPRRIKMEDGSRIAFFWIESAIVKHLHKVTPAAWVVYLVICSFARNSTQQAWPSIAKMAELIGCSRNTVRAGVRSLKDCKLIAVKQTGRTGREHFVYTLLPVGKIKQKSTSAAKNKAETRSNFDPARSDFEGDPVNFCTLTRRSELEELNKKEEKQGITGVMASFRPSLQSQNAKTELIPEESWQRLTEYLDTELPAVEWRELTRDNAALRALWAINPDVDAIIAAIDQAAAERDDADGVFGMAAGLLKQQLNGHGMRASA